MQAPASKAERFNCRDESSERLIYQIRARIESDTETTKHDDCKNKRARHCQAFVTNEL
jgi:hypothetical protein